MVKHVELVLSWAAISSAKTSLRGIWVSFGIYSCAQPKTSNTGIVTSRFMSLLEYEIFVHNCKNTSLFNRKMPSIMPSISIMTPFDNSYSYHNHQLSICKAENNSEWLTKAPTSGNNNHRAKYINCLFMCLPVCQWDSWYLCLLLLCASGNCFSSFDFRIV